MIKVFDAESGKLFTEIKAGHSTPCSSAAPSPHGAALATWGADKFVKVELPTEADKEASS